MELAGVFQFYKPKVLFSFILTKAQIIILGSSRCGGFSVFSDDKLLFPDHLLTTVLGLVLLIYPSRTFMKKSVLIE